MVPDTKELVNGYPTNRRTQSKGIFGNLYFLSSNGDLAEWGQVIKSGFLEYHFQQFSELPKPKEMKDFLREIKEYRYQSKRGNLYMMKLQGWLLAQWDIITGQF